MSVGRLVGMSVVSKMRRRNYVALQVIFGRLKLICDTRVIHFNYALEEVDDYDNYYYEFFARNDFGGHQKLTFTMKLRPEK